MAAPSSASTLPTEVATDTTAGETDASALPSSSKLRSSAVDAGSGFNDSDSDSDSDDDDDDDDDKKSPAKCSPALPACTTANKTSEDAEVKRQGKRRKVIEELVSTERSYLRDLEIMVSRFK